MDREQEIAQIQKDCEYCSNLRMKLVAQGLSPDNEAVQHLDRRIWYLVLRMYLLTEKNSRRKARVLRDLGTNLN